LIQLLLDRANASITGYLPQWMMAEEAAKLFALCYDRALEETKEEMHSIWSTWAVAFATSLENVTELLPYLAKDNLFGNFPLAQRDRWSLVQRSMAFMVTNREDILAQEVKRDATDRGKEAELTARSSEWLETVKSDAWARYIDKESKASLHHMGADMAGFRWAHQRAMLAPYANKFFGQDGLNVFTTRDTVFIQKFVARLFPSAPEDPSVLKRAEQCLARIHPDRTTAIRAMTEAIDQEKRMARCVAPYVRRRQFRRYQMWGSLATVGLAFLYFANKLHRRKV